MEFVDLKSAFNNGDHDKMFQIGLLKKKKVKYKTKRKNNKL